MGNRNSRVVSIAVVCTVLSACAIRLGGAKPETYNAMGLRADGASAADVASRIKAAQGDLVLLSANRDSAWFADVATQAGLTLTRPGHTGPSTLGLMTHLKLAGDTAISVPVTSGGRLHIKDALYTVDKERSIDLMLVSFGEVTSVRDGVRALLKYIATDVGGTSALVIGIDAPSTVAADSVSTLVRAAFNNALSCGDNPTPAPAGGLGVQLFYGPEARLSCNSVKVLPGNPNAVVARVVVER